MIDIGGYYYIKNPRLQVLFHMGIPQSAKLKITLISGSTEPRDQNRVKG